MRTSKRVVIFIICGLLLAALAGAASAQMMDNMEYMPPDETCKELPASIMVSSDTFNLQCQVVTSDNLGVQSLVDMGLMNAVDVWSGENLTAEVCFSGAGSIAFLAAAYSPRKEMPVDYGMKDGMTCANITRAGTVVLLPSMMTDAMDSMEGMEDAPDSDSMMDDMDAMDMVDDSADEAMDPLAMNDPMRQMISLSDCEVITQFNLVVRDGPAGEAIGLIPYNSTVPGIARTPNWIKIQFEDGEGWITGHYTDVMGHCY